MPTGRMRRVNEAVRQVVSEHLAASVEDPRVGFVTVTGVEAAPDLSHARVWVSVLGDESARDQALEGLASSRGLLQAKLGRELRMKRTPTLEFTYDQSIDRGMRMEELLGQEATPRDEEGT